MHPKPAGTNLLFPLSQVEGMVPTDSAQDSRVGGRLLP